MMCPFFGHAVPQTFGEPSVRGRIRDTAEVECFHSTVQPEAWASYLRACLAGAELRETTRRTVRVWQLGHETAPNMRRD